MSEPSSAPQTPPSRQLSPNPFIVAAFLLVIGLIGFGGYRASEYQGMQTLRTDVDAAHVAASTVKLQRLEQQRADLAACFDALLADARVGRAYFKVYRQFKMYNDPRFNPALVAERAGR